MMSSRFTSDEMGHNPQAQDLPRSKHTLVEGNPEEVMFLSIDDPIGVYAKPESC